MTIILGIDPGSRKTGFGIIECQGDKCTYVASGVINVAKLEFAQRLKSIYESILQIIEEHQPEIFCIERI